MLFVEEERELASTHLSAARKSTKNFDRRQRVSCSNTRRGNHIDLRKPRRGHNMDEIRSFEFWFAMCRFLAFLQNTSNHNKIALCELLSLHTATFARASHEKRSISPYGAISDDRFCLFCPPLKNRHKTSNDCITIKKALCELLPLHTAIVTLAPSCSAKHSTVRCQFGRSIFIFCRELKNRQITIDPTISATRLLCLRAVRNDVWLPPTGCSRFWL